MKIKTPIPIIQVLEVILSGTMPKQKNMPVGQLLPSDKVVGLIKSLQAQSAWLHFSLEEQKLAQLELFRGRYSQENRHLPEPNKTMKDLEYLLERSKMRLEIFKDLFWSLVHAELGTPLSVMPRKLAVREKFTLVENVEIPFSGSKCADKFTSRYLTALEGVILKGNSYPDASKNFPKVDGVKTYATLTNGKARQLANLLVSLSVEFRKACPPILGTGITFALVAERFWHTSPKTLVDEGLGLIRTTRLLGELELICDETFHDACLAGKKTAHELELYQGWIIGRPKEV